MLKVQHSVLPLIQINQKDSKRNQHTLKHFSFKNGKITKYKETASILEDVLKKKKSFF